MLSKQANEVVRLLDDGSEGTGLAEFIVRQVTRELADDVVLRLAQRAVDMGAATPLFVFADLIETYQEGVDQE